MTVEIDVGPNVTSLIDRAAQQLGVAVDTLLPLYTEQAYWQGATLLGSLGVLLLLSAMLLVVAVRKPDFADDSLWGPVSFVSGAVLTAVLVISIAAGPQAVRKLINPKFYAVQMLVDDAAKIRGK